MLIQIVISIVEIMILILFEFLVCMNRFSSSGLDYSQQTSEFKRKIKDALDEGDISINFWS